MSLVDRNGCGDACEGGRWKCTDGISIWHCIIWQKFEVVTRYITLKLTSFLRARWNFYRRHSRCSSFCMVWMSRFGCDRWRWRWRLRDGIHIRFYRKLLCVRVRAGLMSLYVLGHSDSWVYNVPLLLQLLPNDFIRGILGTDVDELDLYTFI